MKPRIDPTPPSKCMACRANPARYYGTWAAEGLCRACVLRMSPEIRTKVVRDMHPADRRRWHGDGLFSRVFTRGGIREPRSTKPTADPFEQEIAKLLEATETGSESALEELADRVGAKVVDGAKKPPKT